jgi:hypothetical protein
MEWRHRHSDLILFQVLVTLPTLTNIRVTDPRWKKQLMIKNDSYSKNRSHDLSGNNIKSGVRTIRPGLFVPTWQPAVGVRWWANDWLVRLVRSYSIYALGKKSPGTKMPKSLSANPAQNVMTDRERPPRQRLRHRHGQGLRVRQLRVGRQRRNGHP